MNYVSITINNHNTHKDGNVIVFRNPSAYRLKGKYASVQITRATPSASTTSIGHLLTNFTENATNPYSSDLCKTFIWNDLTSTSVFFPIRSDHQDWRFTFRSDTKESGGPIEINDDFLLEVSIKDHI
jgi:hypothetical protein